MIRGLIFDKDDTLIDLGTYWYLPTIKTIEAILIKYNLLAIQEIKNDLEYLGGFNSGNLIDGSVVVCGTNYETMVLFKDYLANKQIIVNDDFCNWGTKLLEENCLLYGQVKPKTEIGTLFEEFRQNNIRLGLITSDNHKSAINCLKKLEIELHLPVYHALCLEIEEYFEIIIAADDSLYHKPDKELANFFLSKTNLEKEEVLIVGDSSSDMLLAKNAGIKGVCLNRNVKADYYIDELKEIKNLL